MVTTVSRVSTVWAVFSFELTRNISKGRGHAQHTRERHTVHTIYGVYRVPF